MNRRVALKNALLAVSGALLVPDSLRGATEPSIRLTQLKMTVEGEKRLAMVVDTLIPETETPGAQALNVHVFVMLMVNDCHSLEEQRAFVRGLDELDAHAKRRTGQPFESCSADERRRLIESLKDASRTTPELRTFNQLVRKRAIQGYRESQYVMTRVEPHRMIPEPYDGYYPASNYEA